MNDLTGKRIIVTGAARGLGKVAALAYVRANAQVLFTATDEAAVNEAIAESGAPARNAAGIAADLSKPGECARIVGAARDAFGGVDVLFNNAGISVPLIRRDVVANPPKFWTFTVDEYRRFLEVNTLASIELACLVVEEMIGRGWGRIICDTTSLDTMLKAGSAPYGASKAGLEAVTAVMAADLEGTGVTANVLVPGGLAATRMADNVDVPRDRIIDPQAMAAPALWLASDASDGVTACRFVAAMWDAAKPVDEALAAAKAPIAWTGIGTKALVG